MMSLGFQYRHYFLFPRPVFLSPQRESCLPPALSPCNTNTTGPQAFARGLRFSYCHCVNNNSYLAALHQTWWQCDRHSNGNKYKQSSKGPLHINWTLVCQAHRDLPGDRGAWLPQGRSPRILVRSLQKTLGGLFFRM